MIQLELNSIRCTHIDWHCTGSVNYIVRNTLHLLYQTCVLPGLIQKTVWLQ